MRISAFVPIAIFLTSAACAPMTPPADPTHAPGTAATEPENSAAAQLQALFDEHWEWTLRESPLFATAVGDDRYDDRLGDVRVQDHARRLERERDWLARLEAIDREALPEDDRVHYDVFGRLRQDAIREGEHRGYLMPITNRGGFHISFPDLPDRVPLRTVQNYEDYISRLQGFAEWTRQHIELMRTGVAEGFTLPAVVLEGAEEAITPHIVDDPEASLLWRPFERFPEQIGAADRERLRSVAREAITTSVVPGYQEFLTFMQEEYIPAGRETIAVAVIPDGESYYQHRVQLFTTLDDATPRQIHETGLSEIRRIRGEMDAIIERVGFDGSFQDFLEFLRTDPQFYAEMPEELMKEVAYVLKEMDGRMPELFRTLPRMPYGIRPVPDHIAPRTTTAYYMRPAGDGSRAGFYYVNTYNLPARPLYEVEALSLHEAVPGHHHQIALQQELDLPAFRRFGGFTVFTEGWALYAERLGLEVGFYEDPYSDFGRLIYEAWRAARLVVDPGMHALGWSRQQAIDFMRENTGLTLHNIETEVDRYIAWPGQALAYKTGELKIRELREEAERALGDAFDVRDFHDVVLLSGAVPLDVLEENVRAWIAAGGGQV
jgi:uncharacterized protein (DUF885 family)